MKRLWIVVIALLLLMAGCNRNKSDDSKTIENNLPDTHVKVKKEYDKDGNISKKMLKMTQFNTIFIILLKYMIIFVDYQNEEKF